MRTVLLGVVPLLLTAGTMNAGEPNNPWMTDYEKARVLARQAGKPMFVVFR